jgi:ech hydrogenase subunit E
MAKTIIPFGPQHPVLPEPIHLSLTVEDEIVTQAVPALGYVHRGLEKLCDIRDYHHMIQVVERVCGICSKIHAMCYCHGLEEMMKIEVPPRAKYLRVIWSELHRVHSHLLWLGLFADAFGFEALFYQLWKIRERVMDINEATTGNRVIVAVNVMGGVSNDLSPEQVRWILSELELVESELKALESTILDDYTVKARTVGKGILTKEQAYELGAAGPTLRGSGMAQDMRQLNYAAFGDLEFEPVVKQDGDSYARARFATETHAIHRSGPPGPAQAPGGRASTSRSRATRKAKASTRVEQPRGELFYYFKANGTKNLDRSAYPHPDLRQHPPAGGHAAGYRTGGRARGRPLH